MLERSGYTVLAAPGPTEAIKLSGQYQDLIVLLVTDVVMPQMNGSDLFKKLQTVCPNLKGEKELNFIEKPFTFVLFTGIVQEIFNKVPDS